MRFEVDRLVDEAEIVHFAAPGTLVISRAHRLARRALRLDKLNASR